MQGALESAIEALRRGEAVMVYDGPAREGETDLVFYAGSLGWREIYELRTLAGGLICYVTEERIGRVLGLPFAQELIRSNPHISGLASKTPSYGDPPAFSIWVNHVSVKTGISDEDRSITVRKLHEIVVQAINGGGGEARERFLAEFMAPGHVPILLARSIWRRRGHTELVAALGRLAGLPPSFVIAEMLGERYSLSLEKARVLAEKRGIPLVTGDEIVEACRGYGQVCWSS